MRRNASRGTRFAKPHCHPEPSAVHSKDGEEKGADPVAIAPLRWEFAWRCFWITLWDASKCTALPRDDGRALARSGYCDDFSTWIKASWGMLILPMLFIRFLPSFCFSSSLRLRVISPP